MLKPRYALFFGSFVFGFFLLYSLFQWVGQKQTKLYQEEITILHEEVENRFKLLVENNQSILFVGSTIIISGKDFKKTYVDVTCEILKNFEEILGLNFINAEGVISQVSPVDRNEKALGKPSQNYRSLLAALEKGERLTISPPFDLYQGIRGIGFYIPVFDGNKFLGWFAIAQGLNRFMEKFVNSKFLGAYHLIIQDMETGRYYYHSANLPKSGVELTKNRMNIHGRDVEFVSWRKSSFKRNYVSWATIVLCSLVFAVFLTLSYLAVEQRGRARKELENIEVLLRATFNSASTNLHTISEQLELVKKGSGFVPLKKISHHLTYLTTLIDQLRVLVKISEAKELERSSMLPMMNDLKSIHSSKLEIKNINLNYDTQEFYETDLLTAHWSLFHSALESILDYYIEISDQGDEIRISTDPDEPTILIFNTTREHSQKVVSGELLPEALIKATIAIQSQNGELLLENREGRALAVILLPGFLQPKVP